MKYYSGLGVYFNGLGVLFGMFLKGARGNFIIILYKYLAVLRIVNTDEDLISKRLILNSLSLHLSFSVYLMVVYFN